MSLKKVGFINFRTYDRFKILFKIINIIKLILALPIILIIILVYPFFKIKFGEIYTKTIGNSVLSTEILFYEIKEKFVNKKSNEIYIWFTNSLISNEFWYKKIKSKLVILPGIFISPIFNFFQFFNFGKNFLIPIRNWQSGHDIQKINSIKDLSPQCDIYGVLKRNPPLIAFNKNENYNGNLFLQKYKILEKDKIVCIHTRSSAYRNEKEISTRNSSIENFSKAINFFISKGFKVIRMGRDEYRSFRENDENFFDYSTCKEQNDFFDFFIISKCTFFVGAASGLAHVAKIFRKPILYHNMFHLPDMLQFDGNFEKIILPKKIYIKSLKKFMNYRDTFDKNYIRPKSENKSNFNDIEIIENTPDEIYSASIEMYDLIVDKKNSKVDQEEFYNIFEKFYSNSLVKKTMISNKFYLDNIKMFSNENK